MNISILNKKLEWSSAPGEKKRELFVQPQGIVGGQSYSDEEAQADDQTQKKSDEFM